MIWYEIRQDSRWRLTNYMVYLMSDRGPVAELGGIPLEVTTTLWGARRVTRSRRRRARHQHSDLIVGKTHEVLLSSGKK